MLRRKIERTQNKERILCNGRETVTPSLYEWFRVVYTLGNPPRSRDFPEKGRMRSLTLPLIHRSSPSFQDQQCASTATVSIVNRVNIMLEDNWVNYWARIPTSNIMV